MLFKKIISLSVSARVFDNPILAATLTVVGNCRFTCCMTLLIICAIDKCKLFDLVLFFLFHSQRDKSVIYCGINVIFERQ